MVFEFSRSNTAYRYEVTPEVLHYTVGLKTKYATKHTFAWKDLTQILPGQNNTLFFAARNKEKLCVCLEPSETMQSFLTHAFAVWTKQHKFIAAKAAFDYSEGHRKTLPWLCLILSFVFPGLLALLLLSDAAHTLRCTQQLQNTSSWSTAHVEKIKKNRRGQFLWTLQFQTPEGRKINGTRPAFNDTKQGLPLQPVTVAYSTVNPENCWDLSHQPNQATPNFKQRKFTLLLTSSFGLIFVLVTLVGVTWSTLLLLKNYPYADFIQKLGGELRNT